MPGFSFVMTLLMGLGALSVRRLLRSAIAIGVAAGLALTAAGVVSDVGWLIDVGIVVASITVGILVGRVIPPKAWPMALVLGALSVADIVWVVSGGAFSADWGNQVLNLSVDVGTSSSSIGTLDLILAAAVTAHWLEREAGVVLSLAAAPLGMVLANIYVALSGAENLPLVPFITLGWLVTEGTNRLTENRSRQQT